MRCVMSQGIPFDPSEYMRAPKLDVASAVALCMALLAAVPKSAPARTKKAAQRLRKATVALQDAWTARQKLAPAGASEDPRPADVRLDRAWSALSARLQAFASLPP